MEAKYPPKRWHASTRLYGVITQEIKWKLAAIRPWKLRPLWDQANFEISCSCF
jgi:hypothetical protein